MKCECGLEKERYLMAKVGNRSFEEFLAQELEEIWICPKCNAGELEITKDGGLSFSAIKTDDKPSAPELKVDNSTCGWSEI